MRETKLTREEIQERIDGITADLKGHLDYTERLCLVADRKDLREMLAALDSKLTALLGEK